MEIGILNGQEITSVLEQASTLSISSMAHEIDINDRVWRGIRNGEWRRPASEKDMMKLLRQETGVFWTQAADDSVAEIRNARSKSKLHRRMELFMDQSFKTLEELNTDNIEFVTDSSDVQSQDTFGQLYATASYYNYMARSHDSAINKGVAAQRFLVLSHKLFSVLKQRPKDDPIASVLHFRVMNDQFTLTWDASSATERSSDKWRERIIDMKFIDVMRDYNDVTPKAWQAPWNALAIASRLEMREVYPDLYERILKSKRFRDINDMRARESYDDDFQDFDTWVETAAIAAE